MTAGEAVPQSLTCPSDSASWWRQLEAVRAVDRVGGPQVSGGTDFRREDTQVKLGLPGDSLSRGLSAPRTHDVHTAPSCRPRSGARTCGVWQGQHQLVAEPPVAGAWIRVCTVPILPPWWLCRTFRGFFSRGRSVGPGFHRCGLGSYDLLLSAGRLQATAAFSLPNPCCAPVVVPAAGQRGVAWLCLVVSAP